MFKLEELSEIEAMEEDLVKRVLQREKHPTRRDKLRKEAEERRRERRKPREKHGLG